MIALDLGMWYNSKPMKDEKRQIKSSEKRFLFHGTFPGPDGLLRISVDILLPQRKQVCRQNGQASREKGRKL